MKNTCKKSIAVKTAWLWFITSCEVFIHMKKRDMSMSSRAGLSRAFIHLFGNTSVYSQHLDTYLHQKFVLVAQNWSGQMLSMSHNTLPGWPEIHKIQIMVFHHFSLWSVLLDCTTRHLRFDISWYSSTSHTRIFHRFDISFGTQTQTQKKIAADFPFLSQAKSRTSYHILTA